MEYTLEPIFGSYALVIGAAIALFAILFAIRESGRITRWQAAVLWTLRLIVCLLMLVILLKPGLTYTRQTSPRGTIAIMMDDSTSMLLPAGDGDGSRWDSVRSIWDQIWNARDAFGKETVLVPFVFDATLRPIQETEGMLSGRAAQLPNSPEGVTTDIGGPLNQLITYPFESPLTAVIWMGDGSQTHTPSGGDPQQLSRRLGQMDVPMYIGGIGPRSDSENAKDLWVQQVPEQLDAFTKNPVNIRGVLQCRGVANRELMVKLLMLQPGKPPKELSLDRLRPTKSEQTLPFRLPLIAPGEPGAYELLVHIDPEPGEAVAENNEAIIYFNVREGGARILYIEGEPRHEMTYIKKAISENSDMQLTVRTVAKQQNEKWPIDLSQQLADGVYDCIILGDVDYKAIEAGNARTIAEQVKKGAGLVTLGGYHSYGPGGWAQSPIDEILPVDISGTKRQEQNAPMELQNHLSGPVQVIPTEMHELLQIDAPERNATTWQQLRPMLAANRWKGVKKAPGIIVHAETSQQQPLLVSGSVDKGRVVSIAFDSTYRWWRQGKSNEHKAFWRKIMYWCLRRESTEEGIQMSMTQRRLMLKQAGEMILQWNGGTNEAEMPKEIQLHLWKLSDAKASLAQEKNLGEFPLQRRDAKSMRAKFLGSIDAGRYEWRAKANSNGKSIDAKLPFV
ncbi:MAG: hypothetical protein ABL921_32295, partial [Pirellula sp.]